MTQDAKVATLRAKLVKSSKGQARKLDAAEQRRFDKLSGLLAKLKADKHVQNRGLQTWLTADEYQSYLDAGEEQRDIRVELTDKPANVSKYEEILRVADFEFSKGNYYLGQHKYEDALLLLQEMLEENPAVQDWFDRGIEWTIESDHDFDPARVPRTITSRSGYKRADAKPPRKLSKVEVKIAAVEQALNFLSMDYASDGPTPASDKLGRLLNLPDDDI